MNPEDYKDKTPEVEEEDTEEYIEYINELAIYYAGGYRDE